MGIHFSRIRAVALIIGFSAALHAQPPYSTGSGQTTTFAFYDPVHAPVPKAPATPPVGGVAAHQPVVSPSQYQANKNAVAPFLQSSFAIPAQLQTVGIVPPRAPGTPPAPIALTPTVSFQGIVQPPPQLEPASPDLAVGPNDILMVVNSSIAQFTKAGVLKQNTLFQDFFSALLPTVCPGGPSNCLIFDPTIRYDQLQGRFLFLATAKTLNTPPNKGNLLLSVSNGANWSDGWKTWVLDATLDGTTPTANYPDFWRVGFDNLAIYLSGNMYNSVSTFQYAKIRVVKKSDAYNLAATTLPYQDLFNLKNEDGSLADSITPVHQRGNPSAVNSQLLVNSTAIKVPSTFLTLWKIVDPTATPIVANRTTITVPLSYNYPAPAPQKGGSTICSGNGGTCLDSGDSRILKAVYRNGFLYTARDSGYTDVPNAAVSITYDVIDATKLSLVSQARLVNTNSFYPSFDVPATTPAGAQFATPELVTGTTTATDGTLTYAGITRLKAGKDLFDTFGGEALNRWGDYFGGAVDPVTGGLWTSGQYAETGTTSLPAGFNGVWGTWAGYFPWVTAQLFTDVPSTNAFSDYINVLGLWGITSGCSATTFCPTDPVLRSQLGVYIIKSMFGQPCPSNQPCATGFTYTTTPYFTDVLATDATFPYIQKLRDLGITYGCTPTTYCPNDPASRSTVAILIVRAKLKALFGENFTYPTAQMFTDVPPTNNIYPYVQKLAELGITAGCSATQFCPDRTLTRQEIAVFIVRGFLN